MRWIVFARMFLILWLVLSFTRLTYAVTEAGASLELPKDIVLLLDNSGSMKKTDPQFLVKKAVEQFVRESPDDTWLGVLVFDRDARLAAPLTSLAAETRDSVVAGLAQLDYRGLLTNIPAAMERAIYELKLNGREDATKSIVFLTDGIVDTGNRFRDFESVRWLREELAGDAARNGIRIYQVALSDEADFQLLQSLAQRTRGEYFRAYRAEDTARVLQRIKKAIIRVATPTPEPEVTPELPESRPGDRVISSEPTVSQPQASVTPSVTRPPCRAACVTR
jgi:Mg-chelatase subunit ChlD